MPDPVGDVFRQMPHYRETWNWLIHKLRCLSYRWDSHKEEMLLHNVADSVDHTLKFLRSVAEVSFPLLSHCAQDQKNISGEHNNAHLRRPRGSYSRQNKVNPAKIGATNLLMIWRDSVPRGLFSSSWNVSLLLDLWGCTFSNQHCA